MQKEKIIILTAPSGAGKTSITHYLLSQCPELAFSISAATRLPRHNEKHCVDYYFMSIEDFQEKIETDAFVEWEIVYEGKYYGTLKEELQRIWKAGKIPVLDIDVKGAIRVKKQFSGSALSIFIEPPSLEELKKRLQNRGTETAESLQARIKKAEYELSFKDRFDKVIVNDNLDEACRKVEKEIYSFVTS